MRLKKKTGTMSVEAYAAACTCSTHCSCTYCTCNCYSVPAASADNSANSFTSGQISLSSNGFVSNYSRNNTVEIG